MANDRHMRAASHHQDARDIFDINVGVGKGAPDRALDTGKQIARKTEEDLVRQAQRFGKTQIPTMNEYLRFIIDQRTLRRLALQQQGLGIVSQAVEVTPVDAAHLAGDGLIEISTAQMHIAGYRADCHHVIETIDN